MRTFGQWAEDQIPLRPANLLLAEQQRFDELEFDNGGYVALGDRDRKIGHIQLQVAKAALKMVTYFADDPKQERHNAVIKQEVTPDVAIYRSQLVNWLGEDAIQTAGGVTELFPAYPRRFNRSGDFSPDIAETHIVRASGLLATYTERADHDLPGSTRDVLGAAQQLHKATLRLMAWYWYASSNEEIAQIHSNRMEQLLGKTNS